MKPILGKVLLDGINFYKHIHLLIMKYLKTIIFAILSIAILTKGMESFNSRNDAAGYLFVLAAITFALAAIFFYIQTSKNDKKTKE